MPDVHFDMAAVVQALDDEVTRGQVLLVPELSCVAADAESVKRKLTELAAKLIERDAPDALYRRQLAEQPTVTQVTVTIKPTEKSAAWEQPIDLTFDLVRWRQNERLVLGFIPALNIEVFAADDDELAKRAEQHIRQTLSRRRSMNSLRDLVELERGERVTVSSLPIKLAVKSPKQKALAERQESDDELATVLKEMATDLRKTPLKQAYEVDDALRRIADVLTGEHPRSVLLVGPSGVGKTAAVHELVRRSEAHHLAHTPFWATSGARLVAGMTGFGMWQERCAKLCKQASKARAIVHVGSLVELLQVGRFVGNEQGVASFLRPHVARGEMLTIAECTPEQLPVIEKEDPHLLSVFEQVTLDEPTAEKARSILKQFAASRTRLDDALTDAGLDALDRLHRRYATYSAYPGRPLRFLNNLLEDLKQDERIDAAAVTAAFARETNLPLFMLEDSVPLDLAEARATFAKRIIGQPRAVDLVVDLLATVKARLNQPGKPIGSLLFIGPTGVGKTETAKALAAFLFGDEARLTRFDMSEYADPLAVNRLIGGFGSPGSSGGGANARTKDEGQLTAKVRQQPFSVVLLDEFEKAHPMFFDLLLQILGDGRLTDGAGRVASFANTVVIMTSNLGARSYQQGRFGFGDGAAPDAERHFVDEVRQFLRPEMFNRIDRIVPFMPLERPIIERIARREIERVQQRDGVSARRLALSVSDDVTKHLAKVGFDVRHGARPLKRAIERELVAPLADAVNQYSAETALTGSAAVADGDGVTVEVKAQVGDDGRAVSALATGSEAATIAEQCARLRRDMQRLEVCPAVMSLTNELHQLERANQRELRRALRHARRNARGRNTDAPAPTFAQSESSAAARLKSRLNEVTDMLARACELEDRARLGLYRNEADADERAKLRAEAAALQRDVRNLLLAIYCERFGDANRVTLGVYGERMTPVLRLARAYRQAAGGFGATFEAASERTLTLGSDTKNRAGYPVRYVELAAGESIVPKKWERGRRVIWRTPIDMDKVTVDALDDDKSHGLVLHAAGDFIIALLGAESGSHLFRHGAAGGGSLCAVDAGDVAMAKYVSPEWARVPDEANLPRRRVYDLANNTVDDPTLATRTGWTDRTSTTVIARLINERLERELRELLRPGPEPTASDPLDDIPW